jgi:hypothetical protein
VQVRKNGDLNTPALHDRFERISYYRAAQGRNAGGVTAAGRIESSAAADFGSGGSFFAAECLKGKSGSGGAYGKEAPPG